MICFLISEDISVGPRERDFELRLVIFVREEYRGTDEFVRDDLFSVVSFG